MISAEQSEQFFELVSKSRNILILNSKADGDSIGGSCALNLLLNKFGKTATSYSAYQIPDYLHFLTDLCPITITDLDRENLLGFDLIITIDSSDLSRAINNKSVSFANHAKFVFLDHHQLDARTLGLAIVDQEAESTCGIITDLFIDLKVQKERDLFDDTIATLLYAGIVSDTDYFAYAHVDKDTFERGAFLMQYGIDTAPIALKFRETLSLSAFKIIQRLLPNVVVNAKKRYAYLVVKREDLLEGEHILIINEASNFMNRALMRIINEVDFSFVVRDINDNKSSVAFRLHNNGNKVNLGKIASHFGGGGHPQSAGAVVDMHVDFFIEELTSYLNKILTQ